MTKTQKHLIPKSARVVLIYVLAILLEATIVNAYLASAITISSGAYSGAPSYTIWKEGSVTYLKDAFGLQITSGTNATTVMNQALDNSGAIFVKEGTYSMDGELQVHSNTLLYGEGSKTILRASKVYGSMITQNGYVNIAPYGVAVQNVTIRDLYLDGNHKADRGIFGRFNNTHIENNYFINLQGYFTKIVYSSNIWIQNNYGYSSDGDGYDTLWNLNSIISNNQAFQVWDDSIANVHSNYTTIHGNIIDAMGASGYGSGINSWGQSHHVNIENNIIRNTKVHGIRLEAYESKEPSETIISNNQIFYSLYDGISVISAATGNDTIKFVSIIANIINNTQRSGIYLLGAGYGKIIANTILDVSQATDNTYDGIVLDFSAGTNTYTNSWLIEGNQIYKTLSNDARYGIFLTSAYHICIGNHVTNGQTAKIQNSSTGSVVDHNLESGFI